MYEISGHIYNSLSHIQYILHTHEKSLNLIYVQNFNYVTYKYDENNNFLFSV